jgi:hypothetical protein
MTDRLLSPLLAATALLVLAACTPAKCVPAARAPGASPATQTPAAPVIQVHDVRDIVSPPGDREGVSRLAAEVRELVVFVHGGDDPGATVTANGTAIVVVATPEMQRKVSDYLMRQREDVRPDGL